MSKYKDIELVDLTDEILNDIIGPTYFNYEYDDDEVRIETRDGGNIGEETAGEADMRAAREIRKKVYLALPLIDVELDTVDEWTVLTLKEQTPDRLAVHMAYINKMEGKLVTIIEDKR